ncbi:MAG: caspase family protein [Anaerolineae bacterium]|nr:caspase family protein [Anaerolineae bacterium]
MTVYALLVGINKYTAVNNLNGCVQDVNRVRQFLAGRVGADQLKLEVLTDEQATRQNMLDTFVGHLGQAQNGDTALFYYSGHGAQEMSPPEFWHLESDRRNETLVCHDSRSHDQAWDLADKELGYLISQVTQGKPDLHTVIILDSCHSGSGTRDDEGGVRMTPPNTRRRTFSDYAVPQNAIVVEGEDRRYQPPSAPHIAMSACRPEELARERPLGEPQEIQGVFTYHLLTALQQAGPNFSYRRLAAHVNALVRLAIRYQTPQIESELSLDQPFLGGAIQPRPRSYTARYDNDASSWIIDGGTIHGISPETKRDTTQLALFSTLADDEAIDLKNAAGQAKVTDVYPTYSKIKVTVDGQVLGKAETPYQAVVIASPLPPRLVHLTGDDQAALDDVGQAIDQANSDAPTLKVKVADGEAEIEQADLRLMALPNERVYRICRTTDSQSLMVDTPYTEPILAAARLQHMARWLTTYELNNPETHLDPNAVSMTVTVEEGQNQYIAEEEGELRLTYTPLGEEWRPPGLRFKLTNNTQQDFFCTLLNITPDFRVWPVASKNHGGIIEVPAGGEAFVVGHGRLKLEVEDDLWQQGMTEKRELFKLLISTNNFDATFLDLDPLPVKYVTTRGDRGALDQLLKKANLRASLDDDDPIFNDWRTVDLPVVTHRPQDAVKIEAGDTGVELTEGVTLIDQAGLTGPGGEAVTARLMTDPESSRDLGSASLPNWPRGNAGQMQPLSLTATRSVGEPGLSVLALENVANYEDVSPQTPLKLKLPTVLEDNEQVLAYGFDGEFFLPLGRVTGREGGTEITIERLPDPEGTRSLTNSIRLYFQKLITDTLGLAPTYPRLAMVTPGEQPGEVVYETNSALIAAKVAAASKVALYIHGIIGETRYMTPSAWIGPKGQRLADHYDLILAFDYENLATGIKETAALLKEKLTAVGLGPGHNKTLHVLAHSMGGLVSRWLVEGIDGGNQMVQHLYMFGTPNGGSPWPKIEDYALTALTIGLNMLAPVTWPVSVATGLLAFIENNDKMLDQMNVASELLNDLATTRDPGLPYTLFAGNTSIIEAARQAEPDGQNRLERLLSKINTTQLLHQAASLAFLNEPNDTAVAVTSTYNVPDIRTPAPIKHELACDHMTYFVADGGWPAMVETVTNG